MAFTAALLGVEPEAVVYNDIAKVLPQFSGFGLAFRSTVIMKEDEIDDCCLQVYRATKDNEKGTRVHPAAQPQQTAPVQAVAGVGKGAMCS